MSENRRIRRFLLRKGDTKWRVTEYVDNKGNVYDYKIIAKLSSFFNLFMGCLKNGFPVAVGHLWYEAWAFYPFFFVRKGLDPMKAITTLNHERIHIRQQRDIHLILSVPILVTCLFAEFLGLFSPFYLLCLVPFVPTVVYGMEMLRVLFLSLRKKRKGEICGKITFNVIRCGTCFEREAVSRSMNEDYLLERKFMAVLSYTGIKKFLKYGN